MKSTKFLFFSSVLIIALVTAIFTSPTTVTAQDDRGFRCLF